MTDLAILIPAAYLVNDYLVNRELPYNIMGRIRDRLQWGALSCFYCAAVWSGIAVYLLWLVEPQLTYPLAIGGGAILLWRYTGASHV